MSESGVSETAPARHRTTVERVSAREVLVRRTFDAPAQLVFEGWTRPELFKRWWVPKSMGMTLLSCDLDVRVGGSYRLVFSHGGAEVAFFGTYLEVVAPSRLVWTNEEGGEGGPITTVTFEEQGDQTLVVICERHPSKESLDAAGTGAAEATIETFRQLDELLAEMGAGRP